MQVRAAVAAMPCSGGPGQSQLHPPVTAPPDSDGVESRTRAVMMMHAPRDTAAHCQELCCSERQCLAWELVPDGTYPRSERPAGTFCFLKNAAARSQGSTCENGKPGCIAGTLTHAPGPAAAQRKLGKLPMRADLRWRAAELAKKVKLMDNPAKQHPKPSQPRHVAQGSWAQQMQQRQGAGLWAHALQQSQGGAGSWAQAMQLMQQQMKKAGGINATGPASLDDAQHALPPSSAKPVVKMADWAELF